MTTDTALHRFHLVVSTNRPPEFLERCLRAVEAETADVFVTVVEQHPTPRCAAVVARLTAAGRAEYLHDPVGRGISRGRNTGLHTIRGEIVAVPDDDCVYAPGVLTAIDERFRAAETVDGLAIRLVTNDGADTMLRWSDRPARITRRLVPYTVSSSGLFLRAQTARAVGLFDERLGTGADTPFGAGEECDFVLRALDLGADIRYEPGLVTEHGDWREGEDRSAVLAKTLRYNRGFGRLMRKHRQYGEAVKWTSRSAAGVVVRAAQFRFGDARFQWAQLRGRLEGLTWGWDHRL